jgi:hypothetical protein
LTAGMYMDVLHLDPLLALAATLFNASSTVAMYGTVCSPGQGSRADHARN